MRFFFAFASALTLLATSAAGKALNGERSVSGPAFPDLQARFVPDAFGPSRTLHARGGPSRTDHNGVNKRFFVNHRQGHMLSTAKGVLGNCQNKVNQHYNNIRTHCSRNNYAGALLELQACLNALIICCGAIKACGNGPFPSQPATNPPTLPDCCNIVYQITLCLTLSCKVIVSNPRVLPHCIGTISSCSIQLVSIFSACEGQFGGAGGIIAKVCSPLMTSFQPMRSYGFNQVGGALQQWGGGSYGFPRVVVPAFGSFGGFH